MHPDAARGRDKEDKLRLGEGPHQPRGHGGGAGQHDDQVVIHVKMVENGDKDECAQVTNKILKYEIRFFILNDRNSSSLVSN